MLDCICGMVEKTQSAINILQQRQIEPSNIRNTEELVTEVQNKASIAITEVKEAALEEIKQAESIMKQKVSDTVNNSKEEVSTNLVDDNINNDDHSVVGTVGDQLERLVQGAALPSTVDHSASTRTGRNMPGCASRASSSTWSRGRCWVILLLGMDQLLPQERNDTH